MNDVPALRRAKPRTAAVAAIIPFALGAWWLVKGTAALRIAEQGPARARQLNA